MSLRWHQGPAITIHKIEMVGDIQPVVTIRKIIIAIELLPLLTGSFHIGSIALHEPKLALIRNKQGKLNLPLPLGTTNVASGPAAIRMAENVRYSIKNGAVRYQGHQLQQDMNIKGMDFTAYAKLPPGNQPWYQRLILKSDLQIISFGNPHLRAQQLISNISGNNGRYKATVERARFIDGHTEGFSAINFSAGKPSHELQADIKGFNISKSLQAMGKEKIVTGKANLHMKLHSNGSNISEIINSLGGKIELKASNLQLETLNLDKLLDQYHKSQRFNLIDLGAYFFVGPLATVATKSYDFAGIYRAGQNDKGEIRNMISRWQISNGIAVASDVAFATRRHRVALKGRINLTNKRLENLKLALVDSNGCPTLSQQLSGSLDDPGIMKPGKIKPLIGPVIEILKIPGQILAGKPCDPFYTGELAHPTRN